MKKIFLFVIIFPILLSGQESSGLVIKTLILQDILYKNPNIIFEKPIKSNKSIEFLLALRNSEFIQNGGEGPPIPNTYDCNGFTIGVSFRQYLPLKKTAPNSWFLSGLLRYNYTRTKNLRYYKGLHSESRIVDLNRHGPELGILFGKQFLILKHVTTELYIGTGTSMHFHDEEFVSGIESETLTNEVFIKFRPFMGLTIGCFVGKKK